ncbi:VF_A0006 family four-cysteine protein [Bradyrhizobium sp. 1]|uniref:VF_A0006 family four-cysteine protein n=1 Tax=Bradyrhizobium sp. 1 TaxID=241591 RepID=UPI001FF7B27F|nr:VF_A0006 family four-cysteine protein [Bradyrhizobium sp. 1]
MSQLWLCDDADHCAIDLTLYDRLQSKRRNMTPPNENYPAFSDILSHQGACRKPAHTPLHILADAIAAVAFLSFSAPVVAQSDMERQAQCELSAIRDTRSALAVQYIHSACNWLVVNGDSALNASSKGYYICLVRQLSGAQGNEAAAAIISACRTSNPF